MSLVVGPVVYSEDVSRLYQSTIADMVDIVHDCPPFNVT